MAGNVRGRNIVLSMSGATLLVIGALVVTSPRWAVKFVTSPAAPALLVLGALVALAGCVAGYLRHRSR